MGFFSKIFKEVSRPFKQVQKQVNRNLKKLDEERRRLVDQLGRASGFGKPEFPDLPPLPDQPAPPATRITGQASDEIRRRQRSRVSGRRKTIVTGELSPVQVGKKTLLGGR